MARLVSITGFELFTEDYQNVEASREYVNLIRRQKMLTPYDRVEWLKVLMKSGYEAFREAFPTFREMGEPVEERRLIQTPDEFRQSVMGMQSRRFQPGPQLTPPGAKVTLG